MYSKPHTQSFLAKSSKFFLASLFFLCWSLFSWGQESSFRAGVSAGITTTQIDGDGYSGWNKAGLTLGGFVNTNLSKRVISEFQINYVQKGSVDPVDHEAGDFDYYRIRLSYMEVPLLFRMKLKKFYYEAGPAIGFLISSSEEDNNGVVNLPFHNFNSTEVSMGLGIGYALTEKFHTNVRYQHSFLPVSNEFKTVQFFGLRGGSFNMAINFALRYQFINS